MVVRLTFINRIELELQNIPAHIFHVQLSGIYS